MRMTGECEYISGKSGTKKDGSVWANLKFLDNDSDEFFSVFVEPDVFNEVHTMPKRTPVLLTLELTPGKTYVEFIALELIEDN